MNTTGLDSSSLPAGLDSWVSLRADLSLHDKATVAIDAITNELPERSALPFEFFELAVLALQKSTDDARAAVQQRNKTIDELRALCSNLEERLKALSMPPPAVSPTASSLGPVAMHPVDSLHKPPKVSVPQSLTQAATSANQPASALPTAPPVASFDASIGAAPLPYVPTPPVALSARPSGASMGPPQVSPFCGCRGTKPNELHVQFKSRAEFNTKLARFFENNIIAHRHALLDALVSAMCTLITDETKLVFADNKLRAAFWSPRGNLIVRFLKAPSAPLLSFFLDTLENICGSKSFTVINRQAISMLKVVNFPTQSTNGSAIDLEQVALDILNTPGLDKAKFWHTPRFVSFKGAPIGRKATLFFSFADSPQYATGRSLVGTEISTGGLLFKVEKWHQRHLSPDHLAPIGGHKMYKENAGLMHPSTAHHNMPRERFTMLEAFRSQFVSPPPLSKVDYFPH
jgi:hypothetical protein